MSIKIRFENVDKFFGKVQALKNFNLEVEEGEFLVLLGPSGCGKTTALRCLAGLEKPNKGRIFIGEEEVTFLPPAKRDIAMVFQSYAVFPHMTVFDNIGFGLKMKKVDREIIKEKVVKFSKLLKIDTLLDRYPSQLSGGQRQRVAVARALAVEPSVLLMDEPLSNLDAILRTEMRTELKRLHEEIGTTTIYVTHDQIEAMSLGDRIAVMFDGEIHQIAEPLNIYEFPMTIEIGKFIGNPPMNFLWAKKKDDYVIIEDNILRIDEDVIRIISKHRVDSFYIGIRPENITVHYNYDIGRIKAEFVVKEELGYKKMYTFKVGNSLIKVLSDEKITVPVVFLEFIKDKIRVYSKEGNLLL